MRPMFSKPHLTPLALALVAGVLLLLYEHFYGQEQIRMTRVGGKMNQCTCSQRLEK